MDVGAYGQIVANLVGDGALIGVVGFFIKRWMNTIDSKIGSVVTEDRCLERKGVVEKKITSVCQSVEKEMNEINHNFRHHKHDAKGNITLT